MARSDFHLVDETDEIEQQFRSVMRRLAGGVSIITAGRGGDITGMTVTSLTSYISPGVSMKEDPNLPWQILCAF